VNVFDKVDLSATRDKLRDCRGWIGAPDPRRPRTQCPGRDVFPRTRSLPTEAQPPRRV